MRPQRNNKPPEVRYELHQKQLIAHLTEATEILLGGAAGGGKSYLMRVHAIYWCINVPGIQVYLFRRNFADLEKNHMDGSSGFYGLLQPYLECGAVKINNSKMEIEWINGSKIHLCHCNNPKDIYKYQGAEIHVLLIDELTHFFEDMYRFLRGRVRLGGLQIPDQFRKYLPRILCGTNPGGIGHQWVKRTWIDSQPQFKIRRAPKEEGGFYRQFIPALLEDNPTLTENDPDYEYRLEGLGSPELVKAMRYGNWDIMAGAALEKLSRDKHMLRRFKVPQHWTKFTSIDWGTAKPFAVGWFCVCDDDLLLTAKNGYPDRIIPKNAVIMYREWYGWNGTPDVGCRMESTDVARRILDIEDDAGEIIDYRIGDSAMWNQVDGPSIHDRMVEATDGRYQMIQSKKDRETNYQTMRHYIAGEDGVPMFYATEDCKHFWRTVPELVLDDLHPNKGPDTKQEEHVYDSVAYALCTSPIGITLRERHKMEYDADRKRAFARDERDYY